MDDRAARTADYAQAQVRLPTLGLIVRPREPGVTEGAFPFGDVVHMITAHNPGAVRPGPTENAARQERLVRDLQRRGLRLHPAEAGAADGSDAEVSVLVEGLDDEGARGVGAAWGQDAVFRWSPSAWTVLACDDSPPVQLGWAIEGGA